MPETQRNEQRQEPQLTQNEQVMKFLVQASDHALSRTQLAKLMYLADYEAHRYLGESITDFNWERDSYGPFDETAFHAARDGLRAKGLLFESVDFTPYGHPWYQYTDAGDPVSYDFSPGQRRILRYVVTAYSRMPRQELVQDVVYETEPFKAVQDQPLGTPVPLHMVDSQRRAALGGIGLEDVAAGAARLRAGQGVPLSQVIDALQSQS